MVGNDEGKPYESAPHARVRVERGLRRERRGDPCREKEASQAPHEDRDDDDGMLDDGIVDDGTNDGDDSEGVEVTGVVDEGIEDGTDDDGMLVDGIVDDGTFGFRLKLIFDTAQLPHLLL